MDWDKESTSNGIYHTRVQGESYYKIRPYIFFLTAVFLTGLIFVYLSITS